MTPRIDTNVFKSCVEALKLPLVIGGCLSPSKDSQDRVAGPKPANQPGYDPSRALLRMVEIKPVPLAPKPVTSASPPLSDQAARRLQRAQRFYSQHRFTEASVELEKALRHEPSNPRLHRMIALVLHASGNRERVRSHLAKAIALNEDDIATHYLLGRVAFDDGNLEEGIRQYRIGLKCSNAQSRADLASLCHFHLARALNAEGYLTAAIEAYQAYEATVAASLEESSVDPELATLVQVNRGQAGGPISVAYEKLGRYSEAADALGRSIEATRMDPGTRERLARLLSRAGRFEEALEQARRLLDMDNAANQLLFEIHEGAGHPEGALDDLRVLYERNPNRINVLIAFVDALERFERLEEAEHVLREASAKRPLERVINWRLADVLRQQSKWRDALEAAADALRENEQAYNDAKTSILQLARSDGAVAALLGGPDNPKLSETDYAAAHLLGSLATELQRRDQARLLFGRALEAHPSFVPARVELGKILAERFEWQPLIDLVSADPDLLQNDHQLERLCGIGHAGLDRFDQAEEHLRAATRRDRTDVEAMLTLAEVHQEVHETRRAQRQYEAILDLNPLHEQAREALVKIYLMQDRRRDAAAQVAELKRRAASPHRIARCVARLELAPESDKRDWDRYRAVLIEALETIGPDADTLQLIGASYSVQWRLEEALESLNRALQLDPMHVGALKELHLVYRRSLEFQESADSVRLLLKRHPRRDRWLAMLLGVLSIDQQFVEVHKLATEQLGRSDLTDEEKFTYQANAAAALERLKKYDELIALLERWRNEQNGHRELTRALIDAYQLANRHEDAVKLARSSYEQNAQDREARLILLDALLDADRQQEAEQLILEELETDPDNDALQLLLTRVLAIGNRYEEALELLDSILSRTQSDVEFRELRLVILGSAERHDEVVKLLTTWLRELEMRPGGTERTRHSLKLQLAGALLAANRYDDCIVKLTQWIDAADRPALKFAYLSTLSGVYQRRAQPKRVLEILEDAYELKDRIGSGQLIGISNDFGYTLADAGLRIDEAERMIRYALANNPNNGAYLDSYGWVLYKRGAFAEAKAWLEKAVNTPIGDDPVLYDHLGDAHWRLGLEDAAERFWNTALERIAEQLEEEERPDYIQIRANLQEKIKACESGKSPQVAPLATGRNEPTSIEKEERDSP